MSASHTLYVHTSIFNKIVKRRLFNTLYHHRSGHFRYLKLTLATDIDLYISRPCLSLLDKEAAYLLSNS